MVIGGGAREHTLVWKLRQSKKVAEIYVAPGNAGTAVMAENLDINSSDLDGLSSAAKEKRIDLIVVGPEAPLAAGIVDIFNDMGIRTFGPSKEATLIESSKVFAKELMHKYSIPCARDKVFTSFDFASDYVKKQSTPMVIKADGLAAGKGVIIAQSTDEALKALSDIMEARIFGDAGSKVLVEECLVGQETSFIAFTDGKTVVPMVPARDYKRVYDDDLGPNTGGMGVYSPPGFFNSELADTLTKNILEPTVRAMEQEGKPYKGVLYAGLMLTSDGPKVLEFNARFGDPETQVQLPLLQSDLVDVMMAVIDGTLDNMEIEWSDESCVGVVMASGGYPGSYSVGYPITGLDRVDSDLLIFHAGTEVNGANICTAGGRVLTVTATGETVKEARQKVYNSLPLIQFQGCHYRKDIAAEEM
ncbi:MAG: phosphoribosylamine--glycine ligase [Dehalococcoidia bacterium]|nr:MAG: phosphoribosylamine--glycine ligase [Dehalococcoidia bacterium]